MEELPLTKLKEELDARDYEVTMERRELSQRQTRFDQLSNKLKINNLDLQNKLDEKSRELENTEIELQEQKKKNRELNALLLEQSQRPEGTRRVYLQGRCWN